MLQEIDDFLIDKVFQPIINIVALIPLLSRYNLSRISTWGSFGLTYLQIHVGNSVGLKGLSVLDVMNCVFLGVLLYSARYFERIDSKASARVLPSARFRTRTLRYLMLIMLPVALLPTPFPWTWFNVMLNAVITAGQITSLFVLSCRCGAPPHISLPLHARIFPRMEIPRAA